MTSSQPIVTPNALNYTPDNKHCYAYSGLTTTGGGSAADGTLLLFNTLSGYIKGTLQYQTNEAGTGTVLYVSFKINDVAVYQFKWDGAAASQDIIDLPQKFIIPAFSKVEFLTGSNSGDDVWTAQFIGKVYGMTETGYQ